VKGPLNVLFDLREPTGDIAEGSLHLGNLAKQMLKFFGWCTKLVGHGA
jgi:hypothetical protein